jgi:hypothetical protein
LCPGWSETAIFPYLSPMQLDYSYIPAQLVIYLLLTKQNFSTSLNEFSYKYLLGTYHMPSTVLSTRVKMDVRTEAYTTIAVVSTSKRRNGNLTNKQLV